METEYQIIIGSPLDYNELVAYIVINGKHFALISQEDGKDRLKIDFFEDVNIGIIDYNIFLEALQKAKESL